MPRAFFYTLVSVNAGLGLAGALLAAREGIPAGTAAPIIAAFLLQVSFYLVPGFPGVRRRLEGDFAPASLALIAVAAALLPYLIYSVPTGVFQASALLKLVAISAIPTFVFVLWPARSPGLCWQDAIALATVAVAELGKVFRQIYVSPLPSLRLEVLGRIMIIGIIGLAFLSIRRLDGSGYQFATPAADWKTGIKNFLLFLPLGALFGLGTRFMRYQPVKAEAWQFPLVVFGTFWGIYLVVALFEELVFRGILQNLLAKTLGGENAAQIVASVVFGLSHITFRGFPNWRAVVLDTILGWFCGRAYRERQSVVASSITHALVVTVWRVFFAG